MNCRTILYGLLSVCAVWNAAVLGHAARPNIVLLESDDHHYLALGCLGDPLRTPHIDRLAERGVLLRNNICQGTACAPSRNALLTASYPHNTGVYHNQDGNMAEGVWTFPQALRRAGYTTALVGKNHFKPHSTQPPRERTPEGTKADLQALGFDYVHAIAGKVSAATSALDPRLDPYREYLHNKGVLELLQRDYRENRDTRAEYVGPSALSVEDYHDDYIATRAIDYLLQQRGEQPFFLWVDFVAPHPPADAPEPYATMYDPATMRPPLRRENQPAMRGPLKNATDETFQRFRAAYYGMITLLDEQVGRIVAALEETGQLENTLIVFTGDQGSMLGDLGMWGKGEFYKGSINSPLVVAGPKRLVRQAVVDRPVELIDLAPTFLEVAGAASDDLARCRGESLLPLLTGRGEYRRTHAFAEEYDAKMVATVDWKYAFDSEGAMLFDLNNDPHELRNVIDQHPEIAQRMRQRLVQWLEETGPVLPPNPVPPRNRAARGS